VIVVSLIGLAAIGVLYFINMLRVERRKKHKRNKKRLTKSKGISKPSKGKSRV
jgi:hypothetical protein